MQADARLQITCMNRNFPIEAQRLRMRGWRLLDLSRSIHTQQLVNPTLLFGGSMSTPPTTGAHSNHSLRNTERAAMCRQRQGFRGREERASLLGWSKR